MDGWKDKKMKKIIDGWWMDRKNRWMDRKKRWMVGRIKI